MKTIYKDNEGVLYTPAGKGKVNIKFKSGIKQGCGLSPLLWVIYINPLLTRLKESKIGYRFNGKEDFTINNITFDYINLLAESEEEEKRTVEYLPRGF